MSRVGWLMFFLPVFVWAQQDVSAYARLESYVTLYEATGDSSWLLRGQDPARQLATWMVSYNYRFHDTTAFGKARAGVMGSLYANTQNKHTAPGICTGAGVGLLKLYHYAGDAFCLEMLRDMSCHIPQYHAHPLKPLGTLPVGYVSVRVNVNDWEGLQTIGYVLPISTWAETSLILTTAQVPELLIETGSGRVTAFDNVMANVEKNTNHELVISKYNPSPVLAKVRVMELDQGHGLRGENFTYGLPQVSVEPGKTIMYNIRKKKRL